MRRNDQVHRGHGAGPVLGPEHRPHGHVVQGCQANEPLVRDDALRRRHRAGDREPEHPEAGADWPQVHVYVPGWQRAKVKQARAFELVDDIKPFRLFEEDLAKTPERWVLSFSWPMAGVLDRAGALEGARAIWSMWPGYLEEPSGLKLQAFLAERSIPMTIHHTSGHASIADLQRLAKALSPARVVPIHSFGAAGFDALFEGVEHHDDGDWWDV